MKLSFKKEGVSFGFRGKELFFRWWWVKNQVLTLPVKVTPPIKKLTGFDYSEILFQWAYLMYPDDHVIVLHNINVQAKNIAFWTKLPVEQVKHFIKDVVILRCKDVSEMTRLINNIGLDFAEAYGFSQGQLIITNTEQIEE